MNLICTSNQFVHPPTHHYYNTPRPRSNKPFGSIHGLLWRAVVSFKNNLVSSLQSDLCLFTFLVSLPSELSPSLHIIKCLHSSSNANTPITNFNTALTNILLWRCVCAIECVQRKAHRKRRRVLQVQRFVQCYKFTHSLYILDRLLLTTQKKYCMKVLLFHNEAIFK